MNIKSVQKQQKSQDMPKIFSVTDYMDLSITHVHFYQNAQSPPGVISLRSEVTFKAASFHIYHM